MEFVAEDALPLRGDTPAARVSTGANTPWTMATVVFKTGGTRRRRPRCRSRRRAWPSAATAGGSSPAAKTLTVSNAGGGTMNWTASESASWLSLSPTSGTNDGTITATPSITGLAAGTYTTDVTVTATGAGGLAEDDPGHADASIRRRRRRSTVSPASLSFTRDAGRRRARRPRRWRCRNTGGGSMDWTASDERGLAERVARERDERGHDHGDAVDHRPDRGHLHRPT